MDHRKELKEQYKEIKIEAGIYTITNTQSEDVYVGELNNLIRLNGIQFQLKTNTHKNKKLQADWNELGEVGFKFEVIEVIKQPETGYFDMKKELEKRQLHWIEQLNPTYND